MKTINSIEELLNANVGDVVWDSHEYLPKWLHEWNVGKLVVNLEVVEAMINEDMLYKLGNPIINKMVRIVAIGKDRVTMACPYDQIGVIYTIEL